MGVKQYQIILANLDPTQGSELRKTRPCVVLSPNEMNDHLHTVVIAPLTTARKNYPSRVSVSLNNKHGFMVLDQIRTIDKSRIIKILGALSHQEILDCKLVLKEIFVD